MIPDSALSAMTAQQTFEVCFSRVSAILAGILLSMNSDTVAIVPPIIMMTFQSIFAMASAGLTMPVIMNRAAVHKAMR